MDGTGEESTLGGHWVTEQGSLLGQEVRLKKLEDSAQPVHSLISFLRNEFIMIGQVGSAVNAAVGPVAGGQIGLESLGSCHLHHWRC